MRLNLKLWHKGLVLVAVPLVFNLIFVLALKTMVSQAEAERVAESHSKAVVSLANTMTKYLFDGAAAIVAFNASQNRTFYDRSGECAASIGRGVKELQNLTEGDRGQRGDVAQLKPLADRVCNLLLQYRQLGEDLKIDDFKNAMAASYTPFVNKLHQIAAHETLANKDLEHSEKARSERLSQFLVAGLAVNVLIAILLALFFRGVTERLTLLMQNASALARKETLHEPLSGSDEVSEPDRIFHEMARALKDTDQRKQEFVSTICHDLRAPLAAVQATLAMAATGKYGELTDRGQKRFDNAERNIERLIQLLNELLDVERMHAGVLNLELKIVNINQIISQSVDLVKAFAEKRNIGIEAGQCDLQITADESRLIRVVVNLLSNAIKFSPAGTTVILSCQQKRNWVELTVADQGKGIAAADQAVIFDRFQRLDESQSEGVGLGLTICKGIVEAHGGQIGVESTEGKGSTFWLRIPTKKMADKTA